MPEATTMSHATARRGDERAFLPAALEIVETPPSPIGRALQYTVILVFAVAITWACIGEVDIVAVAPGRIIPTGKTKVIQPLEIGVVRAIHVTDGQAVKAGEALIELDPTTTGADRERLTSDLTAARLDVARLRAGLTAVATPGGYTPSFATPEGATTAQVELQAQLLRDQLTEHRARLAGLDRQRAQREAERDTVAAEINRLNAVIPVLRQRVEVRRYLMEKEYGSKLTWLEVHQEMVEREQQLMVQRSRHLETEAALAAVTENRRQVEAEFRRTLLVDLTQAEQKAAALAQELVKAEQRTGQQVLKAPVDGVVQQLQAHTIGGVVTPAEPLMVIVPSDARLEVEALVQNKDVGFVVPGQVAEIKVDTFNFTKYGLIPGEVVLVSRDTLGRDNATGGRSNRSAGGVAAQPSGGQDMAYAARISLQRNWMQVGERRIDLGPGMSVSAEIKTGSRKLIEYLLSPLIRYLQEVGRES